MDQDDVIGIILQIITDYFVKVPKKKYTKSVPSKHPWTHTHKIKFSLCINMNIDYNLKLISPGLANQKIRISH